MKIGARESRAREFRHRIVLYAVSSLLIMGVVIGVVATYPLMKHLREAAREDLSRSTELTARSVGEFVRSARNVARQVTSRSRIREALAAYDRGAMTSDDLRAFTEPKLADALALSDHAVGITRLDRRGMEVSSVGQPVSEGYYGSPHTVTVHPPAADARAGTGFVVAAPIIAADGRRVGTDLVLFDAAPLLSLLAPRRDSADAARRVALYDGQKLVATLNDGFAPAADSPWRWEPSTGSAHYVEENWITSSARISDTSWSVAVSRPRDSVYASAHEQAFRVLLSVAIVLFLGVGGAVVTVRPLSGYILLRSEEMEREVDTKTAQLTEQLRMREEAEKQLAWTNERLREANVQLEQTAEAAEEQRNRAEEANNAKTAFLGNMSHDLRTPLQGIIGFLSLLSESVDTPEERRYVRYAEQSASDLQRQVDELLEVSRIESGGIKIVAEDFDLRDSVRGVIEMVRPEADRKRLSVSARVADEVPQAVRSDPVRFRQVLANLVENAVKYTDDGWVVVSVGYTEPGSRRGELLVSVQDTGPGIPEEDTERIFDRFSRLSYTSATSSGAGLGLTISKALVEMMGGSLWCESRLEQGSTFRMRLPVNTPRNGGHLQQGPATTAAVSASEGLRVLVAEDDRVNRVFISHLLRRLGHEPTPVTDGKEALEKLGEGAFDVVLMDVQMPNMNGVEATEAIRASHWAAWRDLPIVAMTAYVGPEHEAEFAAAGMNATLTKPLDAADLQRVLAHAVPQRTLS